MVLKALARLRHLGAPPAGPRPEWTSLPATEQDIDDSYRLFLGRDADDVGRAFLAKRIQGGMTLRDLAQFFLTAPEYRLQQAKQFGRAVVDFPCFSIAVDLTDDAVGLPLALARAWEPHVTAEIESALKPGAWFLDVGANIGYFTLLGAARVGPAGRVFAFEPNPGNVRQLRYNVRSNGFTNVEIHPLAVADKAQAFLCYGAAGTSLSLLVGEETRVTRDLRDLTPTAVRAVALDEHLGQLERLDVLKIDTDGSEPIALRGMHGLLKRHRPAIFFEYFVEGYAAISRVNPDEFFDELRGLGYDLFTLSESAGRSREPADNRRIAGEVARTRDGFIDLVAYPRSV